MSENFKQLLSILRDEWRPPEGFFIKARGGVMDEAGYERVVSILETISDRCRTIGKGDSIDRELVLAL